MYNDIYNIFIGAVLALVGNLIINIIKHKLIKDQYKFKSLQPKVLEDIGTLYKKFIDFKISFTSLLCPLQSQIPTLQEKFEKSCELYNIFIDFYYHTKIFIPEPLCMVIEKDLNEYFKRSLSRIGIKELYKTKKFSIEDWTIIREDYSDKENIIKGLENDFRRLIGINI